MCTVSPLILLAFKMLNVPRAKAEARILNKLAFVTNKCVEDVFGKFPRPTESLSK